MGLMQGLLWLVMGAQSGYRNGTLGPSFRTLGPSFRATGDWAARVLCHLQGLMPSGYLDLLGQTRSGKFRRNLRIPEVCCKKPLAQNLKGEPNRSFYCTYLKVQVDNMKAFGRPRTRRAAKEATDI